MSIAIYCCSLLRIGDHVYYDRSGDLQGEVIHKHLDNGATIKWEGGNAVRYPAHRMFFEVPKMREKPTLCVDFDGVMHAYTTPWTNPETISDGPVLGALRWIWKATEWFQVVIYSSRSKTEAGIDAMHSWFRSESIKEFGEDHPMSTRSMDRSAYPIGFVHEKPAAFLTIDDRAFCFEGDWSELEPADLLNFKPWNKRGPK